MVSFYMRFIFKIWLLENFGFTVATVLQSADGIQCFKHFYLVKVQILLDYYLESRL